MNTRNQHQPQQQRQQPALATRSAGGEGREPTSGGVVGRYLTQGGSVGAEIRKHKTTYSYIGAWGAGGGHCYASMKAMLELMLRNRRGWTAEIPFPSEPKPH